MILLFIFDTDYDDKDLTDVDLITSSLLDGVIFIRWRLPDVVVIRRFVVFYWVLLRETVEMRVFDCEFVVVGSSLMFSWNFIWSYGIVPNKFYASRAIIFCLLYLNHTQNYTTINSL